MRPSPAPLAQEYVNPELDSSVIGGHAAPSKDFLPTDIQTTKNLPLYTTNRYLSYGHIGDHQKVKLAKAYRTSQALLYVCQKVNQLAMMN